ncbi:hypothetical protein QBC36DRAFT_309218 [Triangularia setosa]|uniref:Uncharacterized protein n=1 Tax=Triangularia setosa TaxID=2587417 RepID=A0AAN6WE36_9PEZI|nr:hypothetical protein QBC36DRAFT_309218 [Podospora setosa]
MKLDLDKMRQNGDPIPPKDVNKNGFMVDVQSFASLRDAEADHEWAQNSLDFGLPVRLCHIMQCFNKTVPIYLCKDNHDHTRHNNTCLLRPLVHNYVYSRWFRPYRSEIDWEQFPIMTLESSDPDPNPMTLSIVPSLSTWSCSIACSLFENRVRTFIAEKAAAVNDGSSPSGLPPGPSSTWVNDIAPDKLAAHWYYSEEQGKTERREGELRKDLRKQVEENKKKDAIHAMGIVEWRWNRVNPNDLEDRRR